MIKNWDDVILLRKQYDLALEPVCKKWGLTRNELDVLLFLAHNPQRDRATDIVERRGLSKSHVSAAVRQLERKGYISGTYDPLDRRTIHLAILSDASPVVKEGLRVQEDFFGMLLCTVTPEEAAMMDQILEKLARQLHKMGSDANAG